MRNFPVNVQITDTAVGGTNFTPVGSFSDGYPLLPILDLTRAMMEVPAGARLRRTRWASTRAASSRPSTCRSQKVLPHNFTAQVGYVGNRQNDMVAEPEHQLQPDRRRKREPAVQPARTGGRIQNDGRHQRRASAWEGSVPTRSR